MGLTDPKIGKRDTIRMNARYSQQHKNRSRHRTFSLKTYYCCTWYVRVVPVTRFPSGKCLQGKWRNTRYTAVLDDQILGVYVHAYSRKRSSFVLGRNLVHSHYSCYCISVSYRMYVRISAHTGKHNNDNAHLSFLLKQTTGYLFYRHIAVLAAFLPRGRNNLQQQPLPELVNGTGKDKIPDSRVCRTIRIHLTCICSVRADLSNMRRSSPCAPLLWPSVVPK